MENVISKFSGEFNFSVFYTEDLKTIFTAIAFDFFCLFAWMGMINLKKIWILFQSLSFSVVSFFKKIKAQYFSLEKETCKFFTCPVSPTVLNSTNQNSTALLTAAVTQSYSRDLNEVLKGQELTLGPRVRTVPAFLSHTCAFTGRV